MAQERRIVIAFGRFNPPTTGHEALALFLIKTARRLNAEARIYPSPTTDSKKNPLPFREKVGFLRQLFPQVIINDNPAINNPFAAFADVSAAGYKDITVVVGADRVRDFEEFAAYLLPASSSKYNTAKHIDVTQYHVLSIPRGVGAISASLMRGYVVANDFSSFLAGTPRKNITVAKKIFASLRQHMHIREQRDKMRQKIQEATVASSLKKGMYAVVAIENNKVLPYSMAWDFNETEIVLYANMLRAKHPQATISIEAKGGRVSQVLKPGDLFKESYEVELKPGTRVKTPYGRGKIVRYDKGDGPHGSPYYMVDVGKHASEKVMAHQLQREEKEPVSEATTRQGIMASFTGSKGTFQVGLYRTNPRSGMIQDFYRVIDKKDGKTIYNGYRQREDANDMAKQLADGRRQKPGGALQREETMIGPGSRVKTPYGIGQVVRYDKVEKFYIVDVGKNAYAKVTPPTWIVGQTKKVKPNQIQRWSEQRENAPMGAPKPPSDVDRLKVRQATDTITLKQRQATELMAAKIRDVETKAREAQTKATAS